MVLDECLAYPASHEAARQAMQRTVRWARGGFRASSPRTEKPDRAGAVSHRPRIHVRRPAPGLRPELLALDAPGYAIGGLSVGEPRSFSLEMTEVTAPLLPQDRPRYVMGVGMPEELPEYVARGVDMMDCVLPSRNARNGSLFTSEGRVMHQAGALSGRSRRRWIQTVPATPAAPTRGPICGTCSRPAKSCSPRSPRYIICITTLTPCDKSGRLYCLGDFPHI